MKLIRTNSAAKPLYVLGWLAWCYRLPALMVYALVPLVLVSAYYLAQDLVRQPGVNNVGAALVLGLFFLIVWAMWRSLQAQAARIILFPDRALLLVRTLNLTSRRIPLAALETVQYEEEESSEVNARIPVLTVQVRGGLPIKIDLGGRILDEQAFKALFHCHSLLKSPVRSPMPKTRPSRFPHTENALTPRNRYR